MVLVIGSAGGETAVSGRARKCTLWEFYWILWVSRVLWDPGVDRSERYKVGLELLIVVNRGGETEMRVINRNGVVWEWYWLLWNQWGSGV